MQDLEDPDPDDIQLLLQAASASGRAALGKRAGRRARTVRVLAGREVSLPPRCASCDGYNLHAGVVVRASDRKGLERLCRYLARPPVARDRLEWTEGGDVVLRFKRPWSDGTSGVVLSPSELLQRLAALVPPPGILTVLYHGVLSSRAERRSQMVPKLPPAQHSVHRLHWADPLARTFEIDGFACPHCSVRMTLRAVVLPGVSAIDITEALQAAARAPPQADRGVA